MEFEKIAWEKSVEVMFDVVLLKLLYDAVYKKIPRGFWAMRKSLMRLEAAALEVHADHEEAMETLRQLQAKVESRRRRRTKKKARPGPGSPL